MSNAQNFPPPSLPIMDQTGAMSQPWFRLLLTLWNRTGGLLGTAGDDLSILSLLTPAQDDETRVMADLLETALFAERQRIGEVDGLKRRVADLESRLIDRRDTGFDALRQEVKDLKSLMADRQIRSLTPVIDPYPYMRR